MMPASRYEGMSLSRCTGINYFRLRAPISGKHDPSQNADSQHASISDLQPHALLECLLQTSDGDNCRDWNMIEPSHGPANPPRREFTEKSFETRERPLVVFTVI